MKESIVDEVKVFEVKSNCLEKKKLKKLFRVILKFTGKQLRYKKDFIIGIIISVKVFKNGPSKICGRQPLKNLK